MSNLYKYIQMINEEEAIKENEGQKYERLIALALSFLVIKEENNDEIKLIENKIDELEKNPKEIAEIEFYLNKLKKTQDIEEINNIIQDINMLLPSGSIQKISNDTDKKIKLKISYIRKYTEKVLKNRIKKITDIKELNDLKNQLIKPEYKEFFLCWLIDDLEIETYKIPQDMYMIAYRIAKEIKSYICKNPSDKLNKVYHIGSRMAKISKYWRDLFVIDKNEDNTVNDYFKKSEKKKISSFGKTDILVDSGQKKYNLSLKMEKNQLGSPTYIDIYTLILHAINMTLNENFFIQNVNSEITNSNNQILNIDKDIQKNLVDELKISDVHTGEYITIINISIALELFCIRKVIKDNNDLIMLLNKATSLEIKELIGESGKQDTFMNLFITDDDIIKITSYKDHFEKLIIEKDGNAVSFIDSAKKNSSIKILSEDREALTNFIKLLQANSKGKYFGSEKDTASSINKLISLFNNEKELDKKKKNENDINPYKYEVYKNALNLRNIEKNAALKFKEILDVKEDIINKIFKKQSDEIIKKLNTKKTKIKQALIEEAITGRFKFSKGYGDYNYFVASHVVTFDKNSNVLIEEIDDNFIAKMVGKVNIDFSFKAGDNRSSHAMRLKIETSDFKFYKNNQNIYNENLFSDIKSGIENIFSTLKIKTMKILHSSKNKLIKLFNLFGLRIKIKKAKMPQWIVDKL